MKTTTHFVERQHKLVLDMSRQPMRERQLVAVLAEMVVLAQHWNERKKTDSPAQVVIVYKSSAGV